METVLQRLLVGAHGRIDGGVTCDGRADVIDLLLGGSHGIAGEIGILGLGKGIEGSGEAKAGVEAEAGVVRGRGPSGQWKRWRW